MTCDLRFVPAAGNRVAEMIDLRKCRQVILAGISILLL